MGRWMRNERINRVLGVSGALLAVVLAVQVLRGGGAPQPSPVDDAFPDAEMQFSRQAL